MPDSVLSWPAALGKKAGDGLRRCGWLEAAFLAVLVVALGLRLFELSGRTMHYDEAIHLHFSFKLANSPGAALGWPWIFGTDYFHSAWMHGPFQVEMVAAIFTILGDTDFTSRLGYALFGTALAGLPYFLRHHIGRRGALIAAIMLTLSPALLYFSRFGRNDIIMMFWAVALFTLMWRYLSPAPPPSESSEQAPTESPEQTPDTRRGRRVYLYLASALLAFMFATKETAYLLVAIFGLIVFISALPELLAWIRGRAKLAREGTHTALLLLLVTLTLPQWSAIIGLFQGLLGLTLANPDPLTGNNVANLDGSKGMTGAPAWQGATLLLPVLNVPWPGHAAVAVAGLTALIWLLIRGPLKPERLSGLIAAPLLAAFACAWIIFRPYSGMDPENATMQAADWALFLSAAAAAVGCALWSRFPLWRGALLLFVPTALTALYSLLFTPVLDVQGMVNAIMPGSASIRAGDAGVPANYVVALAALLGALTASAALGIWWLGRAWLLCAAIFYLIWTALYTTLFTNLAGIFTGSWQGMGYWIGQQDVARGNQPWYYYFVGLSVYELLPLVFGIAGIVYFLRQRDFLGLTLAAWAVLSLAAYTVAAEKMPWLLVNITTPFILLAAKFLGELADRLDWRGLTGRGQGQGIAMPLLMLALAPLIAAIAVYLFLQFIDPARPFRMEHWLLLASTAATALVAAYIYRVSGLVAGLPPTRAAVGLGLAALLLGLSVWGAFRAAYTYDDSSVEVMVYAQGAADLQDTYRLLEKEVYPLSANAESVKLDMAMWYPIQWYVRDHTRDGRMLVRCFEATAKENSNCITLEGSQDADGSYKFGNPGGMIVRDIHAVADDAVRETYRRDGAFRNLLWFPETYRRPDETVGDAGRRDEAMLDQLNKDFRFFADTAASRESWASVLDYVLFRNLKADWQDDKHYIYLP